MEGLLPSFATCPALKKFYCFHNKFTGECFTDRRVSYPYYNPVAFYPTCE